MPRPPSDKRERIVQTATELAYQRGFHGSSLADIARSAGVPSGSVYYFFKTKDDLARAVVDGYIQEYTSRRGQWDRQPGAQERLHAFLAMTTDNGDALARFGCPIGTLCGELQKQGGVVAMHAAQVFQGLLDWLAEQFVQLGASPDAARGHAEHLLGAVEGATLLTHSFQDRAYIDREVGRLRDWIAELAAGGGA